MKTKTTCCTHANRKVLGDIKRIYKSTGLGECLITATYYKLDWTAVCEDCKSVILDTFEFPEAPRKYILDLEDKASNLQYSLERSERRAKMIEVSLYLSGVAFLLAIAYIIIFIVGA